MIMLRTLAKQRKTIKLPPLSKHNKEKRIIWKKMYMKTDYLAVIFYNECKAILDGPRG